MDQAKSENKILYRYVQECGDDPDMDCTVYVFVAGLYQIPIKAEQEHAANITSITTQPV